MEHYRIALLSTIYPKGRVGVVQIHRLKKPFQSLKLILKEIFPLILVQEIDPPCTSTIFLTIPKPIPVPSLELMP